MIRLDITSNEVCKEYNEVIEKSALCIKKIKETVERAGLRGKELKTVKFDGVTMNQVLDHISISEAGRIVVTFLEETEVDL